VTRVRLHTIYRTTGSENRKARPAWYSKALALESYLGSLAAVSDRGDVVFVVDGPMADGELTRLRDTGEVVQLDGVGNSSSYRWALGIAFDRTGWTDDDLVYFAEDDYLYRPAALPALCAAARDLSAAAFFTPYDAPDYYDHPAHDRYRARHERDRWDVDRIAWRAVRSTTMTYAARLGALRQVTPLHVLGTRGRYPRDFDIWSGTLTYAYRYRLARSLPYSPRTTPVRGPRPGLAADARAAFGRPPGLLIAPEAPLATHGESDWLTPGADWAEIAAELSR
jgi:hypothetical protein